MLTFFKVLLHILYFVFVALVELLLWNWLFPLIGGGFTFLICAFVFAILMMIYAAVFWGWRPSGSGISDFFGDIGDFGGDFS